ncbi:MAG TPA: glycosyltransferase family A protein [Thermoanaerobaculia bacterium]
MTLSVVVPAFNASATLRAALESVLAQLPEDAEVVVVDDGSQDDTLTVARSCGAHVRVIAAEHRGIAETVNRGVEEARGDLLAFIDADDVWLAGKLALQMKALDSDPSLDGVLGHLRQQVSEGIALHLAAKFAGMNGIVPGLHRGTLLIRRTAWDRAGNMEKHLDVGEFVSWYLRAIDKGLNLRMLPEVVYERRIHGANTMLGAIDLRASYLRIAKATLDRRRAARQEA